MSIMAKTPSGYKKIGSAYLGERPVDKVFNENGDVVYALQRELTGVPPLLFKGKEQSELLNYRICGDTVDGNSVGDLVESGQHAGEYKVPVTVEGKNLLRNTATSQTFGGVMVTVNSDGSMTCNGTAITHATLRINIGEIPSGIYKLSGCPKNGAYNTYRLDVRDSSDAVIVLDTGNGHLFNSTNAHHVELRIENGYTCENLTFYPMIRKADIEDDTYEPYHAPVTTPIYLPEQIKMVGDEAEYIDYKEQKLHRVRKNLLPNTATSQTINGVTFTVNSDGSVTCNGTASRITYFDLNENFNSTLYAGMKASFFQSGQQTGINTFVIRISKANRVSIQDFTMNDQVIIDNGDSLLLAIRINSGYTCDNLTFYPMIRKADIEDDTYEPYIENTDLDVTLPALPTIKGTNVLSMDTEVQPSRMDIKGRIKSLT